VVERSEQELGRGRAARSALKAAVLITLAVVTAGGGAWLLTRWVNARAAAGHVATEPVVVAALDLPIGTELRAENLGVVQWPSAGRPASVVADPAALVGRVVITHIFKGEPVLAEKLAGAQGHGLAALLTAGMRAVSVRVDDVVGVAGFIHPGDFVDVIVTIKPNEAGTAPPVAKTILQNIKVLAVGKEVDVKEKGRDKVLPATVATLMVDSSDAERLALAASKGQLLLALRSGIDTAIVETTGMAPPALLAAAIPEPAPAAPEQKKEPERPKARARVTHKPAPATAPTVASEQHVVEIMRGDLFERRDFDKGSKR